MGYQGHSKGHRILNQVDPGIPQALCNSDPVASLYLFYLLFYVRTLSIIAPAVCKLDRNIPLYPQPRKIIPETVNSNTLPGIRIRVPDKDHEIADLPRFMEDVLITTGNLSLRLPGKKSSMDELAIVLVPGQGTTVSTNQWERHTRTVVRLP